MNAEITTPYDHNSNNRFEAVGIANPEELGERNEKFVSELNDSKSTVREGQFTFSEIVEHAEKTFNKRELAVVFTDIMLQTSNTQQPSMEDFLRGLAAER